ncbi:unnamed protein product [Lupinus luteus]|uniref:Uncharacterized protein n=1 Tax=Lupinus luteus TaxID=3873 RepID=A0AAV1YJ30_LUPLU
MRTNILSLHFKIGKGFPVLVSGDQNESNTISNWTERGRSRIRKMKVISSEDSNEENKIPMFKRVVGGMRAL